MPNDEIVKVHVTNYRVQIQSHGTLGVWLQVVINHVLNHYGTDATDGLPAVFDNVEEATALVTKMRDQFRNSTYRVIRDVTITEVVHV